MPQYMNSSAGISCRSRSTVIPSFWARKNSNSSVEFCWNSRYATFVGALRNTGQLVDPLNHRLDLGGRTGPLPPSNLVLGERRVDHRGGDHEPLDPQDRLVLELGDEQRLVPGQATNPHRADAGDVDVVLRQ